MPRTILAAALVALCAGTAQAQYQGGSPSERANQPSPTANPGPLPRSSSGAAKDIQNAPPTSAECDRLMNDRSLKSGGLINEDMKAKVEQCQRMKNNSPPPP